MSVERITYLDAMYCVCSVVKVLARTCGVFLCTGMAMGGQTFYVSTRGNDVWSGRLPSANAQDTDGPFASITRARDAIRHLKTSRGGLKEPVCVQLRGGVYYLTETVSFGPEDSGTKECPISYVAYPGERPVLCGGRRITGWRPYQGKIQRALLPEVKAGKWCFRSLFADGERQTRARHPNVDPSDPYRKGFLYVGKGDERIRVGCIHNVGDWMEYEALVPAQGEYAVWVRYGHGMRRRGVPDMGGRTSIAVDAGAPILLMNLPDTGGSRTHKWSRCASLRLSAGRHVLRWRNDQSGGLDLDTFALCDDPLWTPRDAELPPASPGKHVVVIEAESFLRARAPQLLFTLAKAEAAWKGDRTRFPYTPGTFKPTWANAPEAEVHVFPSGGCRNFKEIVPIEKVDEQACMVTIRGKEARTNLLPGDRYFVENLLEELDSPGEWYLDRQAGTLYYWPMQDRAPTTVVAPTLGRMFEFRGDEAKGSPVSHIRLAGLTVQATDYSPDDRCDGSRMGNDGVVYLSQARGCVVEGCTFRHIGKYAVCIAKGAENRVSGNEIAHSAEGGVLLLKTARNTVSDNHIHHCGAVYKHIGGVVMEGAGTDENLVSHNLIHDISRYGVSFKCAGKRNVVEYNHVHRTNLETYDTGGIEVTQQNRKFRSDSSIRHNLVHDTVGFSSIRTCAIFLAWGVYLDSFAGGYTVSHNVLYHNSAAGVFVQGGKDNKVFNNILADNGMPQLWIANFQRHVTGLEFRRNVVFNRSSKVALIWAYNDVEKATQFERNLYFCPSATEVHFPGGLALAQWQEAGRDRESIIDDPRFVDPTHDNYALRPDSPAFSLGFEAIDVSKIGLLSKRCECQLGPRLWDFAPWMSR